MQTIKVKELQTVAERLEKHIVELKKEKVEHERNAYEMYLLRLENILSKYKNRDEEATEIAVDTGEFETFRDFKRGL
jgi:hypothetical protein